MKKELINASIPENVHDIGRILTRSGEDVYLVGGALRDILANRACTDFDLATTATPNKVAKLFPHVIPTGIQHGTVTIMIQKLGYEVTTLRGEGAYSDGRRPDSVEYIDDIETDLARRDFTINAMAWDLKRNRLHDPFDGQRDLKHKLIKAVGNPRHRLEEDALRALRAARFAATLGYELEKKTLRAIPPMSHKLARVSAERKQLELVKILGAKIPSPGLRIIEESGLLPYLCPKRNVFSTNPTGHPDPSAWAVTLRRVDALPPGPTLRLAGLLLHGLDTGNDTGTGQVQRQWLREMKFEKRVTEAVTFLIKNHSLSNYQSWSDHTIRKFIHTVGRSTIGEIIALKRGCLTALSASEKELMALMTLESRSKDILDSGTPLSVRELPIGGQALMEKLGLTPGPQIGHMLAHLLDEVLRDPKQNNKKTLLTIATEYLSKRPTK